MIHQKCWRCSISIPGASKPRTYARVCSPGDLPSVSLENVTSAATITVPIIWSVFIALWALSLPNHPFLLQRITLNSLEAKDKYDGFEFSLISAQWLPPTGADQGLWWLLAVLPQASFFLRFIWSYLYVCVCVCVCLWVHVGDYRGQNKVKDTLELKLPAVVKLSSYQWVLDTKPRSLAKAASACHLWAIFQFLSSCFKPSLFFIYL